MIVAVPPKTLTAKQIDQLTKKGYIVIETDNPDKIRVITPEAPIEAHDYYMAALYALQKNDNMSANTAFIKELYRRLNEKQAADHAKTTTS